MSHRLRILVCCATCTLFSLLTTDAFAEDGRCAEFARDERARLVKIACDSFAEELLPREIPKGKLDCDSYVDKARDKCMVFVNAGKEFMARPDVAAEYEKYIKRARLSGVMVSAFDHKMRVQEYFLDNKKYPNSNIQAGINKDYSDKDVTGISIGRNGVITVFVSAALANSGKIIFIPQLQSDESISFKCLSQNIEISLLPKACRDN